MELQTSPDGSSLRETTCLCKSDGTASEFSARCDFSTQPGRNDRPAPNFPGQRFGVGSNAECHHCHNFGFTAPKETANMLGTLPTIDTKAKSTTSKY
jgi:hypothetical protein